MIFGDKSIYAIEVYHQPLDDDSFYMTGKMCIYLYNKSFGDIDNEYCHLYPTWYTLLEKIRNINELEYNFYLTSDFDIFNFLDNKLYLGDEESTPKQIKKDAELYGKFDFLTNAGETFDRTKSFIYMDKNEAVHILYQIHDEEYEIICNEFDTKTFVNITNEFIKWYEETDNKRRKNYVGGNNG